ncbi:hypothetical protein H8356DRAFT_1358960 [Neocallimastix lanati (nom. inval.)]|nr:hypothetical protein H8356DRAFT_1358960 [Neocallimastix sp. JGI-2020a]
MHYLVHSYHPVSKIRTLVQWLITLTMINTSWCKPIEFSPFCVSISRPAFTIEARYNKSTSVTIYYTDLIWGVTKYLVVNLYLFEDIKVAKPLEVVEEMEKQ